MCIQGDAKYPCSEGAAGGEMRRDQLSLEPALTDLRLDDYL